MGQLIKLQDYVSRYEIDIYRYPSQYIRLKKQQWNHILNAWENGSLDTLSEFAQNKHEIYERFQTLKEDNKKSVLAPLKQLFSRVRKNEDESSPADILLERQNTDEDEIDSDDFIASFQSTPNSIDELKIDFLENLFTFQMKWASSTIREESFVDSAFKADKDLKYFLQRFPDTYLVMYKPVFVLKHAPIEVDIIMISPTTTWCITILEGERESVFLGSKERFWLERNGDKERKVLSPLIGLNRMEKIVKKVFQLYEVDMPIKKVILNRNGYFDYPFPPYDVDFIEKRNYDAWFTNLRNLSSPLKHVQLKAAQALLMYCQTTCVTRTEWAVDDDK
ncbi:NERD domain-containing protein [Cytobacillus suaedae]|nr:NERD domain-containing protein [Cytobacillus suaedae]